MKKRVHVQLVLNATEVAWYDSLGNKAAVFRKFVQNESEQYQAYLDREVSQDSKY